MGTKMTDNKITDNNMMDSYDYLVACDECRIELRFWDKVKALEFKKSHNLMNNSNHAFTQAEVWDTKTNLDVN